MKRCPIAFIAALALAVAMLVPSKAHAVSEDNFAVMNFQDGIPRSVEDFRGYTVAVFAFCRG
ncbi:MAG: hypothetical protein EA401_03155 [Planctomycetota bacterium]|nr:MAG: hypothetical protein EA401_03155 [Planctomycetota bacterium]